jgi:hypothetical protein
VKTASSLPVGGGEEQEGRDKEGGRRRKGKMGKMMTADRTDNKKNVTLVFYSDIF